MKKTLIYSLALILGATAVTSCSDDDPKGPAIPQTTFTAETLDLTFSGAPMEGKSVEYVPDYQTSTATLTLFSDFDLSVIPGDMLTNTIAGPGIIPGAQRETINVELKQDGNAYTFSGTQDATYCTYSYSGKVSDEKMTLAISDVKLKNNPLANTTWKPLVEWGTDVFGDPEVVKSPFHFVWTSGQKIAIIPGFFELSMEELLTMVTQMTLIPDPSNSEANMSAVAAFEQMFKQVSFREDSNILAKYMEEGAEKESPLNIAHYVPVQAGTFNLYLNPQAIMKQEIEKTQPTKAISSEGLVSIIDLLMERIAPMLASGVPLNYTIDGDNMTVTLPSELVLPLVKEVVLPLVKDPEFQAQVIEMIKNSDDETLASMSEIVGLALQSLPGVLESTTEITLGINMTKVK